MIITEVTQVLRRYYGGYAGVTHVLRRVTQVLRRCYGVFFPLRSSVTTRNFDTEVRNHMRDTS